MFYGASTGSGLGTLFKVNQDGTGFNLLRSFLGVAGGDGTRPQGDLFEGKDEILYGATYDGGLNNAGTVFAVNRDGSGYRVVVSFLGFPFRETQSPNGGLVDGHGDALYGTAQSGGTYGYGTIFRIGKDGRGYTVLHHFPETLRTAGYLSVDLSQLRMEDYTEQPLRA